MRALAADDASVVAVQEANELEALLVRYPDDLVGCHGRASSWTYGAGTFSGTTSAPSVNLPPFTAMTVTPFWGTWESAENVIFPVMPGKSLVASIADLTAAESVLPARLIASTMQVHGVVAEGGEGVLGIVAVLGLVVGDELLDAVRAAGRVHQRVGREVDVVGCRARRP